MAVQDFFGFQNKYAYVIMIEYIFLLKFLANTNILYYTVRDAYCAANIMKTLLSKSAQLNPLLTFMFGVSLPERFEFYTTGPWSISCAASDTEQIDEEAIGKMVGDGLLSSGVENADISPKESKV